MEGLKVGTFHLTKRLPVAAGIGGGSSDAAAALRLLARLNGLPLSHPGVREAARLTGADVPVCLEPRARMMRGVGEELGPALDLPRLFAVLVNPRVPVETPAVFRTLDLQPGQELSGAAHPVLETPSAQRLLAALKAARNDLEPPALTLQPLIGEALGSAAGDTGLPPRAHVGLGRDGVRALRRLHGGRRGGESRSGASGRIGG